MKRFVATVVADAAGPNSPALVTWFWPDVAENAQVAARILAFFASAGSNAMSTSRIPKIEVSTVGQPGVAVVPFPTAEYALVKAWPEPPAGAGVPIDPVTMLGYNVTIPGSNPAPFGCCAHIQEIVSDIDSSGAVVGPGPAGRLYFPWISREAVTNGSLDANNISQLRAAYKRYILNEGDPTGATLFTTRPVVMSNRGGVPSHRIIADVSVKPRVAFLRSRSR